MNFLPLTAYSRDPYMKKGLGILKNFHPTIYNIVRPLSKFKLQDNTYKTFKVEYKSVKSFIRYFQPFTVIRCFVCIIKFILYFVRFSAWTVFHELVYFKLYECSKFNWNYGKISSNSIQRYIILYRAT